MGQPTGQTDTTTDDRYVVISADGHAGGDVLDYRPYLEQRWHDEFDAWAAAYEIPFDDLKGDLGERNWDSARRLADLEADGQVGRGHLPEHGAAVLPEVVAHGPAARAHRGRRRAPMGRAAGPQPLARRLLRRLAPGRRAGIIQVTLHDIEASVAEVRWAKEAGLTGGVLLPGTPPGCGLPAAVRARTTSRSGRCARSSRCRSTTTAVRPTPPMGPDPEDAVMFLLEITWFSHRALTALMVGGRVRAPSRTCSVVFTEQGTAWVPDELMQARLLLGPHGLARSARRSTCGATR